MQTSPASTARAHAPGETCVLCGSARRTYLFVVGRSRMTRCDECQLVSRTDEGRLSAEAESYALDADSERAIRGDARARAARARKVLCVIDRGGADARLRDDGRLDVTVVTSEEALAVPARTPRSTRRSSTAPSSTPTRWRSCAGSAPRCVPGGDLVVVVGDDSAIRGERLPRYALSAVPLTRATLAAGFRPRACGILSRSIETRRARRPPRQRAACRSSARPASRRPSASASRSRAVCSRCTRAPRRRPRARSSRSSCPSSTRRRRSPRRSSACTPPTSRGVDREIVLVESNSTDGSRELVKKVEHRPGVVVLWEDRPQGKGHGGARGHRGVDGGLHPHPGRRQRVRRRRLRHRPRAAPHALGDVRPRLAAHGRAHLEDPPVRQPAPARVRDEPRARVVHHARELALRHGDARPDDDVQGLPSRRVRGHPLHARPVRLRLGARVQARAPRARARRGAGELPLAVVRRRARRCASSATRSPGWRRSSRAGSSR